MRYVVPSAFVLVLIGFAAQLAAQDKPDLVARAARIAPFVDAQTVVVQRADLGRITPGAVFDLLAQVMPLVQEQLAGARQMSFALHSQLVQAGAGEVYSVVSLADVPNEPPFLIFPIPPRADPQTLTMALSTVGFEAVGFMDGVLFAGGKRTLERLQQLEPTPRPELKLAFEAAGDTAAQVLLLPTADTRRVIEGMLPTLPAEIGGGPSTIVTQGILWAALGIDISPEPSLKLVIQSQNSAAADALEDRLTTILQKAAQTPEVRTVFPKVDEVIRLLLPQAEGDRLTLTLSRQNNGITALLQALASPVQAVRVAARRAQSMNNLKQIGLAMHNYHDTYKRLPPAASYDSKGQPLLSWRVHLLPFLETEELYKQFHLNEPWDSEHNRKLIEKMPEFFRSPFAKPQPGRTTYLVPVGNETAFHGREGAEFREVTDGLSNTIMTLEVDFHHAVIWTKPDDLPFDPKQPERGLGGPYPGGFLAGICDGSVMFIKLPRDADKLRAVFTRDGGEVVEWP